MYAHIVTQKKEKEEEEEEEEEEEVSPKQTSELFQILEEI